MLELSEKILSELRKRNKFIIPVVEIYPRTTEDIVSSAAPANAIARFSNICFDWQSSNGTHRYDAKVLSFPEVQTYLDERLNTAEITFSNVKRGEGSMSRFVLDNNIKGCWMVIRLIFPNLSLVSFQENIFLDGTPLDEDSAYWEWQHNQSEGSDESLVVFWGKCNRPGGINNEELTITATQDLGNYKQEIPYRDYGIICPLEFAREGGDCLGNETLEMKSTNYRHAVLNFGSAGCNKLFSTCSSYGNTRYFQGQRVVAVSGQFSYVTIEEVVKRVLFWTKRKKVAVVKMDNWSSVNQSESSETVPLAFGRSQIQGHPFTWADTGTEVKGLYGFCEGRISGFTFIRSRTEGINILSAVEHHGDYGGMGTQYPASMFGGSSGYNSKLAYLEIVTDGSSPTQVDDAPIITAVIRGLEVPVPDLRNEYNVNAWTNNPVHITRFLLTDLRFGRIPVTRMDDLENLITAEDCDEIIEDRTNCEAIMLPSNEYSNYGIGYRRFRSASRYTAYQDMYERGVSTGIPPEFEEPQISWYNPFQANTLPPNMSVLRQKYTLNGALQERTSLLDFIYEQIMPTFKGFINYGANGKIQIKNRRKADNGYFRMDSKAGDLLIPITNVAAWRGNLNGYVVLGVSLVEAEVREIINFQYSPACNGMPITALYSSELTVSTQNITGGSSNNPGLGYIDISGVPVAGSYVQVTFNTGDDAFTIAYFADGIEDLTTFVRMLNAFLNANMQFHSYLTAYINPGQPGRIWIRCESGYLVTNKPLEYDHYIGEEILRVQAVFENCGELTANQSAQFDNIVENSFEWNENNTEEINALTAKYTSAVDDFHLSILTPRAAWDTIDLEGEISKDELDFTLVDNYWQAAYLTKGEAIDRIDGNLHFSFTTDLSAIRLELGDVVAVRHDSGDGALNYTPVWVTSVETDIDEMSVNLGAKLYLSAAFDYHVQPIEPLITTTLNITDESSAPPPATIGSSGGVSTSTEPNIVRPDHKYYEQFAGLGKYSPQGLDIV